MGVNGDAVFFKKGGKFHRDERVLSGSCGSVTRCSLLRARRVRRRACHRLSSAGFPRGLGFFNCFWHSRESPRLPQTASWHRRERVRAFEPAHDFFKAHQGALKIWLLGRFQLFRSSLIHGVFLTNSYFWQCNSSTWNVRLLDAPDGSPSSGTQSFGCRRAGFFSSPGTTTADHEVGGGSRQHSKARWRTDTIALWSFAESVRLREFAGDAVQPACQSASAE